MTPEWRKEIAQNAAGKPWEQKQGLTLFIFYATFEDEKMNMGVQCKH